MTSNTHHRVPALSTPTAPADKTLVEPREPIATSSNQLSDLTETAGSLRSRARIVSEDTADLHRQLLFQNWQQRTSERGKQAPTALLDELSDLGFSWRDIARMLQVSVPAVQKWRRQGGVSGGKRRHLASLVALCDQIAEHYLIQEIASWFEMPLASTAPVTPIDLFAANRPDLILDNASGHVDVEEILTKYDPEWRETYRSDFEVYLDTDSAMSIRPKEA
ncbi:helix-turn-helix domain-containing protein [Streptomyces sp. NPDC057429]|uniref:helix-turn-helix domain-containing protein n=1 Tax=Streptomyces sp. NPDC057429 TaxID=3346130 RepID=UPI00369B24BB